MSFLRTGLAAALAIAALYSPSLHAQAWRQVVDPRDAGFDPARLEGARRHADSVRSAAVVLVHRGNVIAAWGAVARPLNAHSIRKSLLSGLTGIAVAGGELRLDATLDALGVDDTLGLTPAERRATVRDLIASRSGVYHPAAYADQGQDDARPPRGSQAPDARFFYNNWDFNAAELVVERAGGGDLYRLFADRLATPLGMEDFEAARDGIEVLEPSSSRIAAHTIRISARDLARYGEMVRNRGRWHGVQVVPSEWIDSSTARRSDLGDGAGFGWLWWTYEPGALGERYPVLSRHRLILARGTGGQAMLIVPTLELVIVHRGDTDNGVPVAGPAVWSLFEQLAAARIGPGRVDPPTGDVVPVRLASNLPAPPAKAPITLTAAQHAEVVGEYALGPEAIVRVFVFRGRLFVNVPRLGESELVFVSPSEAHPIDDRSVRLTWHRDAAGRVQALTGEVGGQVLRAERLRGP